MAKKNLTGKALAAAAALTLTVSALGQSAAVIGGNKVSAAETDNYAKLLQASLFFYDANMCGKTAEKDSLMEWRGNCHTFSEVDGGYHDAGDHAMFGLPQGYTASTLGWAYYEFKDSFEKLGLSGHFKTISDHFATFFKNATVLSGNSVSKICIQKGVGDTDHSYWGSPEKQGSGEFGGVDWRTSGCGDIAAEYAASLAASYVNFGNAEDLTYAKALYNYAKQNQSCSNGDCSNFYKSNSSNDDLAWAATWLYIATKDGSYKSDVAGFKVGYDYWVHGWSNVNEGALILGAEAGINDWSAVQSYLGAYNGSGYYFLDKWGSARLNCSAQMCALVANKHGQGSNLAAWAKGQMNYILGQNPANTCFVIGYASNSAKNPHHRASSGYQGYGEFNTEGFATASPSNAKSLIGALVGGPSDQGGTYQDNMNDYVCNEVALDYNAGLVGAAAGLYSVYKTGELAGSFPGTENNGTGGSVPLGPSTPTQAPTSSQPTSQPTVKPTSSNPSTAPTSGSTGGKVLLPSDMTVDTEIGEDGEINNFAEFSHQGAKTATLYVKVNSTDTEISGAFGTWNGEWLQKDFEGVKVPSDKVVKVSYDIPSNAGSKIKAMIFWPHGDGVTIEKVVLDETGSGTTTPTSAPTSKPTSTPTSKPTTAPTSGNSNDITLLPADMTVDTEEGDDKEINNFAEFSHQGASSVTLYVKVNSTDTEISGAFGTWNGEWLQKDFEGVKVPSDKVVAVDYTVPSNAGAKIKAMIFWPHGNGVTIEKVVLHKDGAAATPAPTKAPTTAPTVTPTKTPTAAPTPTVAPTSNSTVKGDADANGSVNTIDVVTLMEALIGKTNLSAAGQKNADMNGDGKLSIIDLILLRNKF